MQSDTKKGKTQSAQSVCDLYSAGSWDGGKMPRFDLLPLCKWDQEMVEDSWQLYGQEDKLISLEFNSTQTQKSFNLVMIDFKVVLLTSLKL